MCKKNKSNASACCLSMTERDTVKPCFVRQDQGAYNFEFQQNFCVCNFEFQQNLGVISNMSSAGISCRSIHVDRLSHR
jgi:hypothetical protein